MAVQDRDRRGRRSELDLTKTPQAVAKQLAVRFGTELDDDRGEILESTGERIRPGDVMILLSRRGILQERLVRALKQAGVPAAGADRLALLDSLPVQDLVALGHAVL